MFIKRFIWGIVGDCVNTSVMVEDILVEARKKNVSPVDLLQARLSEHK